jgi:hypothetical protein
MPNAFPNGLDGEGRPAEHIFVDKRRLFDVEEGCLLTWRLLEPRSAEYRSAMKKQYV